VCLAENSKHCRKRLNCKPRQKEKNDISKAEGMGKGRDGPSHKNLLVRHCPTTLNATRGDLRTTITLLSLKLHAQLMRWLQYKEGARMEDRT
jgi:hypothetical protein